MKNKHENMTASEKIQEWRRSIEPRHIFHFVDENILETMIQGFYTQCNVAMTLRLAERNEGTGLWEISDKDITLSRFQPPPKGCQNFCQVIRRENELFDQACRDCDKEHAGRLVENNDTEPKEYQCWMGFTDCVFPISIAVGSKKHVVAVLFGGQIVSTGEQRDTIRANLLENKEKLVVTDHETIDKKINRYTELLDQELKDQLKNPTLNIRGWTEQLSKLLQNFFDQLYEAGVQKAQGEYIQHLEEQLTQMEVMKPENWMTPCQAAILDFLELTGLQGVEVYTGSKRFFEMVFSEDSRSNKNKSDPTKESIGSRLYFRDFHEFLLTNCCTAYDSKTNSNEYHPSLFLILTTNNGIAKNCNILDDHSWLYYFDFRTNNIRLMTLLLAKGNLNESFDSIRNVFCSSLTRVITIYSLLETLANRQEEFEDYLAKQIHQINTSRSIADKCLERLNKSSPNFDSEILNARYIIGEEGRISTRLAKLTENLVKRKNQLAIKKENVDLIEVIKRIVKDMTPKALSIPCNITLLGHWKYPIYVRAAAESIHDIFENILDNAIKYSFGDRKIYSLNDSVDLLKKSTVNVSYETHGINVIVSVSNYGIGIPEDVKQKIYERVPFSRADIDDDRKGSGLGLVIVQDELDKCGGYLMIDSKPPQSKQVFGEDKRDYHNWMTTVTVVLPQAFPLLTKSQ